MGIKSLRKIQIGKEVSPNYGVIVPATTLWRGMGTLNDAQELQFVEEDIGVLSQPDAAYIPKLEAGFTLEDVDATFEQLPYILSAGVEKLETGVADGVGTGKIYTYNMPQATANTISAFTMEGGDDPGAEVVEYCYTKEFKISGEAGEALKMSAEMGGRQAAVQAFTGAVAVPPVEVILFSGGTFCCGNAGTAFNALTQRVETLLGFELSVTTGWIPRWCCDGTRYFTFLRSTRPEVKLSLTMEHNAFTIAEKALMRATGGTIRKMRLKFLGSALTPGAYTNKTLIIDICGKYTAVPSFDDQDGDNVLNFELTGCYYAGDAAYLDFIVVNTLATLP